MISFILGILKYHSISYLDLNYSSYVMDLEPPGLNQVIARLLNSNFPDSMKPGISCTELIPLMPLSNYACLLQCLPSPVSPITSPIMQMGVMQNDFVSEVGWLSSSLSLIECLSEALQGYRKQLSANIRPLSSCDKNHQRLQVHPRSHSYASSLLIP